MHLSRLEEFMKARISIPLILLTALALTIPIFLNGVPKGNDLQQHFQFALTVFDSLRTGELLPALSSTTNSGFGDVGVRFYPPLSYYVLAVFRLITGSWHDASALAFSLWFFAGGLGIYLWSREYFSDAAALAGALIYMIAPYHVNEIYNASFFAEFAGVGVLPFSFLFVSRLLKKSNAVNIIGLGVSVGLLILTHLPTAIIGSAGLLVFALISLPRPGALKASATLAGSAAIGLLLSAFYWVKVVTELPYVNHAGSEFVARAYDFRLNFAASYFYVSADVYNDRFLWFSDLMFLVAVGLFVPSLLFCFFSRFRDQNRTVLKAVAAVFFLGVFFATPLSSFVWEHVSFLQRIQFPFRWMVLINASGAFIVAAGFRQLVSTYSSRSRPLALLASGLMLIALAFTATQVIRPAMFIPKEGFDSYVAGLSDKESYRCWWAVWAQDSALLNKEQVTAVDRTVSVTNWNRYEKSFELGPGGSGSVRLAMFYYPNWKAEGNGQAFPVTADSDGTILVQVPSTAVNVRVYFEELPLVMASVIVSVLAWLAIFAAFAIFFIRRSVNYVNSNSNRKLI